MTILSIEPDLQADISCLLDILPQVPVLTTDSRFFKNSYKLAPEGLVQGIRSVANVAHQLLLDNGYVVLRGFPSTLDARALFLLGESLGELFEDLSHQPCIVNEASPTLNATLQGNQTSALFLHTDFAMLESPPEATLIQCVIADPLGEPFGQNGVSVAHDIFSKYYGSNQLKLIFDTPLPFAGTKPDGTTILINQPILTLTAKNEVLVRFHPSRIHNGFRMRRKVASQQELDALVTFQAMAQAVRIGISLAAGDILVVNNRTALHDRALCSLSLSKSALRSRVSRILFLQDIKCRSEG
jgi:hypothetical protein